MELLGLLLIILLVALYFLPTIIAGQRNHPNTVAIFCINLFFGWSLIGWVLALVWSVAAIGNSQQTIQIINPAAQASPMANAVAEPERVNERFVADELMKLHDLKRDGVITEVEFEEQKRRLLTRPRQPSSVG